MVIVPDCPADVPKHAEEHAGHEDESVLGLIPPAVVSRHPEDDRVVERPGDNQCKDDPDERPNVRQALVKDRHGDERRVRHERQSSRNVRLGRC